MSETPPDIALTPPSPTAGVPLRTLWAEDLAAHGGRRDAPGYRALRWHRFGNWRMTVEPKLLRAPLSVAYRRWFRHHRDVLGIELPYDAVVGRGVVIEHCGGIVIHGRCVIGDGCILRQGVTLGIRRLDAVDDAPILGKNVNVGAGAKVLGRVRLGDGCQIGANAVVTRDVPAGATALGIPAQVRGG